MRSMDKWSNMRSSMNKNLKKDACIHAPHMSTSSINKDPWIRGKRLKVRLSMDPMCGPKVDAWTRWTKADTGTFGGREVGGADPWTVSGGCRHERLVGAIEAVENSGMLNYEGPEQHLTHARLNRLNHRKVFFDSRPP